MLTLTDNSKEVAGVTVYQIQTDSRIPNANVPAGTLGGWVDSLDHVRSGWLDEDSVLMGEKSALRGNSVVTGSTIIDATVDSATITQSSLLACHINHAEITGSTIELSTVKGEGSKHSDLTISGNSIIRESRVDGTGHINHSRVTESVVTGDYFMDSTTLEESLVFGDSRLVKVTAGNEYFKDGEIVPHAAGCDGNCHRLDGRC